MRRRKLTTNQRTELFKEHGGICWRCKQKIQVGEKWHVGHLIDLACGGKDERKNMAPEHRDCNLGFAARTGNTLAAKIKRIENKHLGAKEPSPWSKRLGAYEYDWKLRRYVPKVTEP